MKYNRLSLIFGAIFAFFCNAATAQNRMVDSLKQWLTTHPTLDSTRVVNLHRLAYRLSEIDQTSAWRYANEANQLAKKLNNNTNLGQSYINYAILESLEGNYAKGQEYYLIALRLFEKTGWERGKAICLNNLAENYEEMNQFQKALEYTFRALKLNQKNDQKRGMAVNYEQIGDIYRKTGKFEESLKYLKKGVELARQADQNYQILPQLLLAIGRNYNARREFLTAFDYLQQATQQSELHDEKILQIKCYQEIANTYKLQGKYKEAHLYLQKALEVAQKYGSIIELTQINKEMARLAELRGQFAAALNYFKSYKSLSDSMERKKNVVRAELVQLKYEAFEKDRENQNLKQIKISQEAELERQTTWILSLADLVVVLLGLTSYALHRYRLKEVRDQQRAQTEIIKQMQNSDKIRSQIARDLHDDLGATLSSVAMLSQAAKRQMTDASPQVNELLDLISANSQRTVATIRDIIWTTRPMNDSLNNIVTKMKNFASEMLDKKQVSCHFEIDPALKNYSLPANQQYNFYMIFKEAINNIAKYAQATQVEVKIFSQHQQLYLRIEDNGVGFEPSTVRGKGNGLFNMEKRVEELGGYFSIQSNPTQGTNIALSLPMAG